MKIQYSSVVAFVCCCVALFIGDRSASAQCNQNFKDQFEDIVFVNANTGFAIGANGVVITTADGGAHWAQVEIETAIDFKDIEFFDDQTGLAAGSGGVLKTGDGGVTWQLIYNQDVNAIRLLSASIYLAARNGEILKTEDGGENWKTVLSDPTKNYHAIRSAASSDLFAIQQDAGARNSAIIRSVNNGVDWEVIKPVFNEYLVDLSITGPTTGYAIGEYDTFLKTTNGGLNWGAIATTLPGGSHSIFFFNDANGFIYNNDDVHYIWNTQDGGVNWDWVALPPNSQANILYFKDNSNFVLCTFNLRSTFYTTLTGGASWLSAEASWLSNEDRPEIVGSFETYQGVYVDYYVSPNIMANYLWTVTGGEIKSPANENSVKVLWTSETGSIGLTVEYTDLVCTLILNANVHAVSDPDVLTNVCGHVYKQAINEITFVDANIGFMAGDGGTIRKTVDGGASWKLLETNSTIDFYDIKFLDDQFGLAGGDGGILKTEDGGQSWVKIYGVVTAYRDFSIHIADRENYYITNSSIQKTSDGGKIWETVLSLPYKPIGRMQYTDANTAFAVFSDNYAGSSYGGVIKTTDNWATYTATYIHDPDYPSYSLMNDVSFIDSNTGFTVGEGLFKSTDGGATWTKLFNGLRGTRVKFKGAIGFIYGRYSLGSIWRSSDSGVTWEEIDLPGIAAFGFIHFFNEQSIVLADDRVSAHRSFDGGAHWNLTPVDLTVQTMSTACLDASQSFFVNDLSNVSYHWDASGGVIDGYSGESTVDIRWLDATNPQLSVRITNDACEIVRTITVTVNPKPDIAVTGPTAICSGSQVHISVSSNTPGIAFHWTAEPASGDVVGLQNGSGNEIIQTLTTPSTEGVARYTIVNNLCSSLKSIVDVTVHPTPEVDVTQTGPSLEASCSNCIPASYQWFADNMPIPGAIGQSILVETNSEYTVRITDNFGCESAITGVVTGLDPTSSDSGISVFPIPAQGTAQLLIRNNYLGTVEYALLSVEGKQVEGRRIVKDSNELQADLPLENLNGGLYLLKLRMGQTVHTVKVVVIR